MPAAVAKRPLVRITWKGQRLLVDVRDDRTLLALGFDAASGWATGR